jgi:hypothetical protein
VALRTRGLVTVGAAVACCALAAACTSEPTSVTTPSLTPPATTPTESQIERQMRLDYEAAERAYRANIEEQDRLAQAGGVKKATPALKSTAEGEYLSAAVTSLQFIKNKDWHGIGNTAILGVVNVGWKERSVRLMSCEDGSRLRLLDKAGSDVTPKGDSRFVQSLHVVRRSGQWKVSSFESRSVQIFEGEPCAA